MALHPAPLQVDNAPRLVSSGCAAFADVGGSSFTITGRGGLPPSPDEPFSSDVVWSDTRLPDPTVPPHVSKKPLAEPSKYPTEAIIPANQTETTGDWTVYHIDTTDDRIVYQIETR